MSIDVLNLGETKWITGAFLNSAEVATDPDTVTLNIIKPSGDEVTVNYGSPSTMEKTSTGNYRRSTEFDEVGRWRWQWVGTGAVQDVEPGQCDVMGNGF